MQTDHITRAAAETSAPSDSEHLRGVPLLCRLDPVQPAKQAAAGALRRDLVPGIRIIHASALSMKAVTVVPASEPRADASSPCLPPTPLMLPTYSGTSAQEFVSRKASN